MRRVEASMAHRASVVVQESREERAADARLSALAHYMGPGSAKRLAASYGGGGGVATPPPAMAAGAPSKTPLMRRTPFELAPPASPASDLLPVDAADGPGGGRVSSSSAQQGSPPTATAIAPASSNPTSPALRPASQDDGGFFGGVNPMAARRLAAASSGRVSVPAPASTPQPLPVAPAPVQISELIAEAEAELAFDWPATD